MARILDLALQYDPARARCDLVLSGGTLALDATPRTAMLLSLGQDRRARADDVLPEQPGDAAAPTSLRARRGTPLDALSADGERAGSRLWLLSRAKQTEATRQLAEQAGAEALAWLGAQRGFAPAVTATWLRRGVLQLVAKAGDAAVTVQRAVG